MSPSAAVTATQQQLLDRIASSPVPVSVYDLARALDRHPNSVRDVAARLLDAGLIRRVKLSGTTPGRPVWGYVAVAEHPEAARLAELSAAVAAVAARSADPVALAYAVGLEWGMQQRDESTAGSDPTGAALLALNRLGYAPAAMPDGTIELHDCPLRTGDQAPAPLTCELHRGWLDGIAERRGTRLEPFVRAGVCRADVGRAEAER